MAEWMPVLMAQAWQMTLLIVVVAAINRWAGKSRPHLAHALWLVVLVKCVTPPVWSSPSGLFCWLQPTREAIREPLAVEPPSRSWSELLAETRGIETTDVISRSRRRESSGEVAEPDAAITELSRVRRRPAAEVPSPTTADKVEWPSMLLGAWALASLVVIAVAVVRWLRCWRMLRNAPQRECSELSKQLDLLAKRLKLRRRVRLIVTESRLGPAVIGLFRTTVLLPALIVDRLAQRSRHAPRDEPNVATASKERSAHHAERDGYVDSPLAPILAHELLHVRRGDLWVGLLQTLAQAVWWCHPLVWWVNRRTTREAERCCDEEVLAELGCDPAAYARTLVDVLELKRELKPVPVFPGVRPVEVTSQRLERIMQLGQGCRRRTPWWCWLLAGLAAAASWPGAAFVVTAEDANVATKTDPGERGGVSPPVISPPSQNQGADAAPLANATDGAIDLDHEPKLGLAYRVRVIRGAEDDLRTVAQKFNEKLIEKPGAPVVVEHDELLRLLKEAQAFPRLKLNSHPVATGRGGESVTIAETKSFAIPMEVTPGDETAQFFEPLREYGWKLTMQPQTVGIESLRLRVVNWQGRLDNAAAVKVRDRTTGEEKLIPGLTERRTTMTIQLKHAQHVVFPITKVPNADSQDVMLVMMQACLVVLDDAPQQPEPTPMNVPGPSIRRVVGVNSDSGVTGEIVLEDSDKAIPVGNFAEIRVEGNKLVPTDEILAMIKSKPGEPVDEKQVRADVRAIYSSRRFFSVEPRLVRADKGVNLLFQVVERPLVERVEFRGAKRFKTQELEKLTELREGSPFDVSFNREAVQRIEQRYRSKGYPWAKVELITGSQRDDRQVIFEIDEGPKVSVGTQQPPTKLQLDGLGQLVWQQGSWFVAVLPMPGSKLIDSGESPSRFRSDGRVSVFLSKSGDGFSNKDQVTISADALELSTDEDGQEFRLNGDVGLRGNGFDASCHSALLKTELRPTGHEPEVFALLDGGVRFRQQAKSERTELEATRAMLLLHGTAITQLKTDENGLVAVLRAPPDREDPLIRLGQYALARFSDKKIVSVHLENVPLKDAIKQLAQFTGRNIVLEKPGLEDESLTERVPITLSLDNVKLSSALKLMLDPLNLGYRVEESGVIVVTSQQRLKGQPVVVTYAVADLAVPIPKRVAVKLAADRGVAGGEFKPSDPAKSMQLLIPDLVKLITSTCQPNSWEEVAGNGSIKVNDSTLSLVVRQTRNVHDEIRDLLEQLRRLHDLQAALHVETLTVPADFWHKVGKDFDVPETDGQPIPQPQDKAAPRSIARLTKKEAALLRSLSRPDSAPKVTLFNGQELELLFGGESPAMRLGLKPVVSADHQALRLQAAATKPDAELDFTKVAAITLDSGHSLLLDVTEVYSVGPMAGIPILTNVPGEDRLFKNTGKSTDRTLLLITGTVLIAEEEEALLGIPK